MRIKLHPAPAAVSVPGFGQFDADEEGIFVVPSEGRLFAELENAGFVVTHIPDEVGDGEEEESEEYDDSGQEEETSPDESSVEYVRPKRRGRPRKTSDV